MTCKNPALKSWGHWRTGNPGGTLPDQSRAYGISHHTYSMMEYGTIISGEILAVGTPQDAMDQWRMDEHWNYVLGSYTLIGVGYAYNSCSDFGGYITVDLGR